MKQMCFLLLFLWIFSSNAFPEGKWTLYNTGGSSPERIGPIAAEGESIWIGTNSGVVKLNRHDGTFQRYTTKDGLYGNDISAIAIDRDGTKWFGHSAAGISSFDNTVFKIYSKENIPQFAELDSLFFAKDWGVPKTADYIERNWGFTVDDIVVEPDNTVLFSSHGMYFRPDGGFPIPHSEVFLYDHNTWKITYVNEFADLDFHLAVDTANPDTVWYALGGGPGMGYFVKPDYRKETDERFSGSSGHAMGIDKKSFVWYGNYSSIYIFDRKSVIHLPADSTGIFGNICAIAFDKNDVKWFGSSMGITRHDGYEWKTYAPDGWYYHYDPSFSGYTDQVYSLVFDADGVLWVGTNKGLYRFEETPTAAQDAAPEPVSVDITGISPNPFNPSTTISFTLPVADRAVLTVYDITGQKVRTLVSEHMSAGTHSVVWDGKDTRGVPVSSGVYLSRLESAKVSCTAKMLLMK